MAAAVLALLTWKTADIHIETRDFSQKDLVIVWGQVVKGEQRNSGRQFEFPAPSACLLVLSLEGVASWSEKPAMGAL